MDIDVERLKVVLQLLMADQRLWIALAAALLCLLIVTGIADSGPKAKKPEKKPRVAKPKTPPPGPPPELDDDSLAQKV
jgi:hypothetical protein